MEDVEGATLQLFQIVTTTHNLLTGREAREALLDVVKPMGLSHPVTRCGGRSQRLGAVHVLWSNCVQGEVLGLGFYSVVEATMCDMLEGNWVRDSIVVLLRRTFACLE
jgi:hypothetical protein